MKIQIESIRKYLWTSLHNFHHSFVYKEQISINFCHNLFSDKHNLATSWQITMDLQNNNSPEKLLQQKRKTMVSLLILLMDLIQWRNCARSINIFQLSTWMKQTFQNQMKVKNQTFMQVSRDLALNINCFVSCQLLTI